MFPLRNPLLHAAWLRTGAAAATDHGVQRIMLAACLVECGGYQ